MKKITLLITLISFLGCKQSSEISNNLNCKPKSYNNLETIEDFKKSFSVKLPKNWKTNLYYDKYQSSIYSADTTLQLTETFLIDITKITKELRLDENFLLGYKQELLNQQLVEINSYKTTFLNKETYFSKVLGKKSGFPYQVYNLFIKVNQNNYIHAKTEVYGDSLANERLCNALSLIEKIEL